MRATRAFITRYPASGERPDKDLQFFQQIYHHKLGDDPIKDTYVVGKDFPHWRELSRCVAGR